MHSHADPSTPPAFPPPPFTCTLAPRPPQAAAPTAPTQSNVLLTHASCPMPRRPARAPPARPTTGGVAPNPSLAYRQQAPVIYLSGWGWCYPPTHALLHSMCFGGSAAGGSACPDYPPNDQVLMHSTAQELPLAAAPPHCAAAGATTCAAPSTMRAATRVSHKGVCQEGCDEAGCDQEG